ncbi:MAG TPA: hypothetical protein VHX38_16810 [Pseudonocardiaceae bacterium]|jgi:hypothetical protein|nr:hypothetical protein [Pseudonocardiaceae bacterium]
MAVADCGTCLNIDHRAKVWIAVVDDNVELHCHGTEIEFDTASLDRLIGCGEQATHRLGAHADKVFSSDRAVSTWVACDGRTPMGWAVRGGAMEMHWGPHVISVTGAALREVLRRARLAQTELSRRLAAPRDDDNEPDLIIPDTNVIVGGAATGSDTGYETNLDKTHHPTDRHGRTWTTDDLEEILRGDGYDCDDAAHLLREYSEPYLADVVTQLEEWINQIRPYLNTAASSSDISLPAPQPEASPSGTGRL